MTGRVVTVNLGVVHAGEWAGDVGRTGIDKRPAPGRVYATHTGLIGDNILDTRHHGGIDQALYAFAREDAQYWATELDREVGPGAFGENLSTEGLDITGALIGERWAVGETVLEVSFPRIPCKVFAGFWQVPDLIRRFTDHGVPGAYLRVITEGTIGAGDQIDVISRPDHDATIGLVLRAFTTQPKLRSQLVDVVQLPDQRLEQARRRAGVLRRSPPNTATDRAEPAAAAQQGAQLG